MLICGTCRRKLIERAIVAERQRQEAEERQQHQVLPFTVIGTISSHPNGLYEEIDMQDASGYSVPNFRKSQQSLRGGYESLASPPPPVPERPEPGNVYTKEPDFFEPGNKYTPGPDQHLYSRSLPTDDSNIWTRNYTVAQTKRLAF